MNLEAFTPLNSKPFYTASGSGPSGKVLKGILAMISCDTKCKAKYTN